jgi:LPXTG-site transpeptidase (sortase) family protein
MTATRLTAMRRALSVLLVLVSLACFGWVAWVVVASAEADRDARRVVDAGDGSATGASRPSVVGVLEIPRLGITSGIAEGDDDATLRVSVGHLPDTPLPWEHGNSALAGHRDRQFRALKSIVRGDLIRVRTVHGDLRYRVTFVDITQPDDLSVLAPTSARTLTLVTCYPFSFLGHATQRFVVRADAIP